MLEAREKMQSQNPTMKEYPTPFVSAKCSLSGPLAYEPILRIVELIPKAVASSDPLNHEQMTAL